MGTATGQQAQSERGRRLANFADRRTWRTLLPWHGGTPIALQGRSPGFERGNLVRDFGAARDGGKDVDLGAGRDRDVETESLNSIDRDEDFRSQ